MPLIIYGMIESPPTRAVMLTAKLLGVPLELNEINILKGEHLTPEYLKINPLRTIPAINDDGFIVFERYLRFTQTGISLLPLPSEEMTHAIVLYLIAKYGKEDFLYPKDIKKQAILNQRMYFNSTNLFPKLPEATRGLKSSGTIPNSVKSNAAHSLSQLEVLLGDNEWIGGTTNYTIADICILSTLENFIAVFSGLLEHHVKLRAWLERGRDVIEGHEEITRPAVKVLHQILDSKEDMSEVLKFMAN